MQNDIEKEIQDKGLTAPRVTLDLINSQIASEFYFTAGQGVAGSKMSMASMVDRFLACPVPAGETVDGKEGERTGTNLLTATGARMMFEHALNVPAMPPSLDLLTIAVLVMKNGFVFTGESACASPENFDAELGRKIARAHAVNKIWPLFGYELRTQLNGGSETVTK